MKRMAKAVWRGGLKSGKGEMSTDSGVLSSTPYSFGTRFENRPGTNPEELIASAHAGCFSMALSGQLENFKLTPTEINTQATVTLDKSGPGWTVTSVHLEVSASVPGCDSATFEKAAEQAKEGCPISRLLNATITMTATLQEAAGTTTEKAA